MRGRSVALLTVAGLLSGAVAALLVVFLTTILLDGPAGLITGVYVVFFIGGQVMAAALLIATFPAMLLGWLLLKTGETRPWARHWLVWGGTGALVGAAGFVLCVAVNLIGMAEIAGPSSPDRAVLIAAFVAAGGLSALFFRAVYWFGQGLLPEAD